MWLTLLFAIVVCIVVLYAPGYLLARSFTIGRFASVATAPLFSVFVVVALGIVLEKLGIACSGPTLLATAVALCLLVLVITKGFRQLLGSQNSQELIPVSNTREAWKTAALYIGVSLAVTVVVFLLAIDGPNSFSRNDDTTFHFAVVRTFLDTGTHSVLNVSSYLDQGVVGGFYPAAWHVVAAIVASFIGNAVAIAANATIVALMAFVFPLGMCLLFLSIFRNNKRFVLAGSLFAPAFCGFPWGFVVWGQLLSNMVSFMLIPLAFVALIQAIETKSPSGKIRLATVVGIGLITIVLSQPNGAFTFGIWAILYCLSRVFYLPQSDAPRITPKHIITAAVLFVCACAIWAIMYFMPFMQTAVQSTWPATLSPLEAIVSGLLFMFTTREGVQPFLSVVVLAGVIYTCKNRRYLWLTIAYAFAFLAYVVSVSTDGVFKQILTGFWYTDYYRVGAMTALFAMPLAALGFVQLVSLAQKCCDRMPPMSEEHARLKYLPIGLILVVFLACQFLPVHVKLSENRDIYLGLPRISKEVSTRYSWDKGLTGEEDAFIKRAMEVIPEDTLVINVPSDGSCWSYGVEGMNTYFRRSADAGMSGAEDSELLRTQLFSISTSSEVRQLVDKLDTHYILMLDESAGNNRTVISDRYKAENWEGIESINEKTPGFTLILSEGDMRLYEILEMV